MTSLNLNQPLHGEDKEGQWIKSYFTHFSKNVKNYANRCEDFIKYVDNGELNPTSFVTISHGTLNYGEWVPGFKEYGDIIIEVLKSVGGPNVLSNSVTEFGESIAGIAKRAENIVKYMTVHEIKYGHNNRTNFVPNPNVGKQVSSKGITYVEPRLVLNSKETDCSGFVSWVLRDLNIITEPMSSQGFIDNSAKLDSKYKALNITKDVASGAIQIQAGDILVRKTPAGKTMGHMGISLGGNMQLDWGETHWWNRGNKPNPRKAYHLGNGGSAPYYDHVFRIVSSTKS